MKELVENINNRSQNPACGDVLKVAAAGGVTGGHLYPNIAVLEELGKHRKVEVAYFCVRGKLEERLLPSVHPEFKRYSLEVQGLKRPLWSPVNVFQNLSILYKALSESGRLQRVIEEFDANFAYVSGGYVSYPVAKASKRAGLAVFVQEQNTVPGKSNVAISKFAERIFVSFEESIVHFPRSVRSRIVVTGNPIWVREGVAEVPHPSVIIVGGSGGSEFLNKVAVELAQRMPDVRFILSTGGKPVKGEVPPNMEVRTYIDNMYAYWRAVDCAITRAGATTISELVHFNVPAVVVPWEGATEGHQLVNARIYERTGLGMVLREGDYAPEKLTSMVRKLIEKGRSRTERENPAKKIVSEILTCIG